IGPWPGNHGKIGAGDLFAGRAVDQHRLDHGAGTRVDELHRRTLQREMAVAPSEQRQQYRAEIAAALGQYIFVARRVLVVAAALEQAGFDQSIQPTCQDIRGDAEALLKLVEPPQAIKGIAKDQDRPPLADTVEAAGDRALHIAKAFALHRVPLVTCTMKVTFR